MKQKLIYSSIVYRKEMALKFAVYILIGVFLLYISNQFLNNKFLSLFFLMAVVVPVFLLNLIMKRFTREVLIDLQESFFSLTIKSKFKNAEEASFKLNFDEIDTYSIQFPAGKFSSIILNLKNGKSVEYSFLTEKQNDTQINTGELLNMFYVMIKSYNSQLASAKQIFFKPSFIASKKGLVCLIGLSCLFVIAVVLHILYQANTLPATLIFGLLLTVQLVTKRKTELDYYKTMHLN